MQGRHPPRLFFERRKRRLKEKEAKGNFQIRKFGSVASAKQEGQNPAQRGGRNPSD